MYSAFILPARWGEISEYDPQKACGNVSNSEHLESASVLIGHFMGLCSQCN